MTDRGRRKDRFRDRLSEYLDGGLGPEEETLLERHLERCEDCARTLGELEAVVEQAGHVGGREPAGELWPGIAARIGADGDELSEAETDLAHRPARRRPATRGLARFAPQLAAGVALVWLSAALVWMAGARSDAERVGLADETVPGIGFPSLLPPAARTASTGTDAEATAEEYADLIAELERVLFDSERPLPPQTVARIRRALVTIDRAIEDAHAALREVPDDPYLQQHMTVTMRRKSEFLAQAAQLAASD
ncbi:zf-HC2 domain-containing protein [Candidatus Palauibacter sp.]|uniref:zf-HC2 domain-containing protein n=1 Tax=Candidatus Palauibacter sp. TaxID=3101350 RepID=UPI003AF26ACA